MFGQGAELRSGQWEAIEYVLSGSGKLLNCAENRLGCEYCIFYYDQNQP